MSGIEDNIRFRQIALTLCVLAALGLIIIKSVPPHAGLPVYGNTSMLTLHLLMELFSIIIAMLVVAVSWHTFDAQDARYDNILIFGFLIVASNDLVHALSYDGMPPFLSESSTTRAIFFWLMGRSFEVATMWLLAIHCAPWQSRRLSLLLGLVTSGILIWFGSYHIDAFPVTFVEGQGVTLFKAYYEYLLCILFISAAVILWRRATRSGQPRYYLLAASSFVMGVGEIAFTAYVTPSDFQNVFGHTYKLVAYVLLYWATFLFNIRAPFEAMHKSEIRLRESELLIRSLSDNLPNSMVYQMVREMNGSMHFTYVSKAVEQINGVRAEDVLRDPMVLYGQIIGEDLPLVFIAEQRSAENLETLDVTVRFHREDGELRWMQLSAAPRRIADGRILWDGLEIDVTERKDLLNEMKNIYDLSTDMICTADLNGYFHRINPAFERILGYNDIDLLSEPFINFVHHDDKGAMIAVLERMVHEEPQLGFINRFRAKDGSYRWLEWNGLFSPEHKLIYAVARDIAERKKSEEQIKQLAFYDSLTHLPNRRLLTDRLHHTMAAGTRNVDHAALLFIDLDNFKMLNDTQGHNQGDLLLIEVAQRLKNCVRDLDTVARLGGDEFIVMLEGLSEDAEHAAAQAKTVGEKILGSISQPFNLHGVGYHCTASIGINIFHGESASLDDLLRHVDTALYQAKDAGRNTLRFFDPAMQAELEFRTLLEADLRHALANRQLKLYYQMQVDTQGAIIGAEALLRWQHPERGMVSPMRFIPIAEDTGLIVPIGSWVLQSACNLLKEWQADRRFCNLQLAINVSARQFRQPDFVEQVLDTLKLSGINPYNLKFELTESLVLDNIGESIAKMQSLRNAGVRFSMDDFGTGQSSLTYLRRLPLDQIKIDQSFVHEIANDSGGAAIVKTIISMAHNLGMEVIAEGVETEQQREFLEQNDCHLYQGYLFGKPVPIEELLGILDSRFKSSLPS